MSVRALACLAGCWVWLAALGCPAAPVVPPGDTNTEPAALQPSAAVAETELLLPEDGAAAIGLTEREADVRAVVTGAAARASLEDEQALYRRPRPARPRPHVPTHEPWRPRLSVEALFYLGLALVLGVVLLLRARG